MLYEYLRMLSRDFDRRIAVKARIGRRTPQTASGRSTPDPDSEDTELLRGMGVARKQGFVRYNAPPLTLLTSLRRFTVPPLYRVIRAILYGTSVGLSFFLMLVFMTYNVCPAACFSNTYPYSFRTGIPDSGCRRRCYGWTLHAG